MEGMKNAGCLTYKEEKDFRKQANPNKYGYYLHVKTHEEAFWIEAVVHLSKILVQP